MERNPYELVNSYYWYTGMSPDRHAADLMVLDFAEKSTLDVLLSHRLASNKMCTGA